MLTKFRELTLPISPLEKERTFRAGGEGGARGERGSDREPRGDGALAEADRRPRGAREVRQGPTFGLIFCQRKGRLLKRLENANTKTTQRIEFQYVDVC